jgi:hypothetical protein
MRAIVRQELAAREAASARNPPESAAPDAGRAEQGARPPSLDSVEALAGAQRIIDDAVVAGRWTPADLEGMRALRGRLTGAQLIELQKELFPAVNSGRVQVTYPGPLL